MSDNPDQSCERGHAADARIVSWDASGGHALGRLDPGPLQTFSTSIMVPRMM